MTVAKLPTGFRWTICALIFFAMTINYMDRQLFSVLIPFFEQDLRLGPTDLALINVSFILPYGFAMVFVGRGIDRVGVKKGLSASYLLWNLASFAHSAVRSLAGFMGVRFVLGIAESGMYPSAVKTVTEWFPVRERATAAGIYNAGANCGAIVAPLLGVWIAVNFGWTFCFAFTGGIGLIWLVFWQLYYRPHRENANVSAEERAYIESDREEQVPPMGFRELFAMRPIYALALAKGLSDAPWWFYLFWLPKCLIDVFHTSKAFMAFALAFVYIVADVGSIAGGWYSSKLIKAGRDVGQARKTAMLICALAVTPVISVGFLADRPEFAGVPSVYWAVGLIAIAAGAHQGFSSNLFTLVSDTVPKPSIAMSVGAINGFAMFGTAIMQFFVGRSVALTSSYKLPFEVAGVLYLVALLILQLLMPVVRRTYPTKRANLVLVASGACALLVGLVFLQYLANKPPYSSTAKYLAVRGQELKGASDPVVGPPAQVGWMEAHWYRWRQADGQPKFELVKLDTHQQPFVESKGTKAPKYVGPTDTEVAASFASTL